MTAYLLVVDDEDDDQLLLLLLLLLNLLLGREVAGRCTYTTYLLAGSSSLEREGMEEKTLALTTYRCEIE